jgi:hypothetical protein
MTSEDFFSEEDLTGDIIAVMANDGTVNLHTKDNTLLVFKDSLSNRPRLHSRCSLVRP